MKVTYRNILIVITGLFILTVFNFASCKYGFKDTAPIPVEVKTFRVNYLDNKAQYVNAQLSPQLTEKLKQKIIGNTRLQQTNNDDAHYDISGYISQYSVSVISISDKNNTGNRLNVGFHLIFVNTLDETKNFETDLNRSYDFGGQLTLSEAENTLTVKIVEGIVDEIFNKIFSNW